MADDPSQELPLQESADRKQPESRDNNQHIVNTHLKTLLDGDGTADPAGASYNSFETFGSFASFSRG